ncbi:MAG: acylphosphatase [Chlamydiota bacterium]|nr:acylphosphatase [Chlamydiota bacterium]
MEKRLEIYYSGNVQGVGFRYTVLRISEMFQGIKGFVRNLSDGRVQVVAEGDAGDLEAFQQRIEKSFLKNYILGREVTWVHIKSEFNSFTIAY